MSRRALISDPNLPHLELAWSPERLAELFNRHAGRALVSVRVDDVFYAPATRCIIRCSLTSIGEPDLPPRPALVSMAKDDRFHPSGSTEPQSGRDADASYIAEYGCLLEQFPADWGLPTLRGATSLSEITPVLAAALGDRSDAPVAWRAAQVLHYRPHRRCVLRYRPEAPDVEPDSVIVKVYPPGSKAGKAAHRMMTLRSGAASAGLDVPEPLLVDERLNVLVMAFARGTSLKQLLRAAPTAEAARQTTAAAASALAALHSLQMDGGEPRTLELEIGRLRKRATLLALVAPALAGAVSATTDRLERLVQHHAPEIISVGHGDFTLSQLLAHGERVAMVDFDRISSADPALDVGNLMGKLHRDALDAPGTVLEGLPEVFLAQYESLSGRRNGLAERARLMQALTIVRWALRSLSPQSRGGGIESSYPFLLLEEANRCLSEC